MKFGGRSFIPTSLLVVLVLSTIGALLLPLVAHSLRIIVPVSQISPSTGQALIGMLADSTLSDHERPTNARLYLVEAKRGTVLHHFDEWCQSSYACI